MVSLQIAGLLLVSTAIGSFLGVVVARWPQGRMMVLSRSHCESCGSALVARDLVPLISWLLARGRCRYCGVPTGWFYPGVEAAALLIALIAVVVDGMPQAWLDCLLGWWLLALAWIDVRRWTLPDALTLPLAAVGLLITIGIDPTLLFDRIVGAAAGYLILRGAAAAYRAARGRDGLGGGDAKLLAAAGAWLGLAAVPQVLLGAAIGALAAVGALRLGGVRLSAGSALAFGPFIAAAIWALWLWQPLPL